MTMKISEDPQTELNTLVEELKKTETLSENPLFRFVERLKRRAVDTLSRERIPTLEEIYDEHIIEAQRYIDGLEKETAGQGQEKGSNESIQNKITKFVSDLKSGGYPENYPITLQSTTSDLVTDLAHLEEKLQRMAVDTTQPSFSIGIRLGNMLQDYGAIYTDGHNVVRLDILSPNFTNAIHLRDVVLNKFIDGSYIESGAQTKANAKRIWRC